MRRVPIICMVVLLCLCPALFDVQPASAADQYVHLGESIQDAIDAASSGDTVYVVDAGEYPEKITLKSGVNVVANNPGTIINANGTGSVVTARNVRNAEISGFVIKGGSASDGAGFYLFSSTIVIRDCIIENNSASLRGGGLFIYVSSPTVIGCTVKDNSAYRMGGGAYISGYSTPTITDCIFENNSATGYAATHGGGIVNDSGPLTKITGCVLKGNTASCGGGVYNFYSSPKMANCTFDSNLAVNIGGALANQSGTQTVTNCDFYGNETNSGFSSVIYNSSGASPTLTNCIVWGNSGTIDYQIYGGGVIINHSDIQGGYTGTNNIDADPLFVDSAGGDFHLQPGSPCIDVGDNEAPFLPEYDFEGDPRVFPVPDGIVDMGVDEVTNQPPDASNAYASPDCIWPANHKMVDISIMGVTDLDGDPVTITITGITSDEPTASDKGSGGAKHAPDASGIGTDTASVRAERSGDSDGRVYVISFTASDGQGGLAEGFVSVGVPHDKSDEGCLADSGQNYDATVIN